MKRRFWLTWFVLLAFFSARAQNDTVLFSARGGFYEEAFQLELYNYYPQNHIRFTTNGNCPTAQSPLYEEPLVLDERLYSQSDIYTIINCPEQDFYLPDSVQHCIVIRAAVFDGNDSCVSGVTTNSYFIRALGCDTYGLPAVSLCADSLDLFDYECGIMVPGINYDPLNPNWSGNYYESGDEWERPMNIEFYEMDNTGINQRSGLRTHGGNGRRLQQKCLKIYAREAYGKKRFKHQFFETIPNNSFKHLVLKPFASSWDYSGVNDHICNQIAAQLDLEAMASRPVILYLNGEYWGVYYIHERPDERFLEDHYDVDIENVNIVSGWNPVLDHGTIQHFNAFYHWMETADLSEADAYSYAETQMDLSNFIDYQIIEIFCENVDWPANNMRMWQLGDGPWRWIFYDGDACLQWLTYYAFDNAVYEGSELWPSSSQATLFFRKLLENDDFKMRFNARFYELLGTSFDYSVTGPIYDTIKARLEPEMPWQTDRFGIPSDVGVWNERMARVKWFLMKRAEQLPEHLDVFLLDLPSNQQSSFQCYPNPTSGQIHLSFDANAFGTTEIGIYDLMGRKVFAMPCLMTEGANQLTFDPNLNAGIYLLRFGKHTIKIVKQ